MNILHILLILGGLVLFETVNSIDNAIINADILSKVNKKTRRMFLTWGLFLAVFVVRGVFPWMLVWIAIPSLGALGALMNTFSSDPNVAAAIQGSAPVLLLGTATFLLCLFLHWFLIERTKDGIKFYFALPIMIAIVLFLATKMEHAMIFSALIGCTGFFVMQGIKDHAEKKRHAIHKKGVTDYGKITYLEMIDASFSLDGVLGAFAFTLSVPLIMIGNGIGALVVRSITIGNIKTIHKYRLIKDGAMYSIFALSIIMLAESFGVDVPVWVPPAITVLIVGYFVYRSRKIMAMRRMQKA